VECEIESFPSRNKIKIHNLQPLGFFRFSRVFLSLGPICGDSGRWGVG
jgi:hypothetical protein